MTVAARRLHPTPPQQVRAKLAASKAAGVEFGATWADATTCLYIRGEECRAWREALRDPDVVREFRAAYEDAPSPLAPLAGLSLDEVMAAARYGLDELALAA